MFNFDNYLKNLSTQNNNEELVLAFDHATKQLINGNYDPLNALYSVIRNAGNAKIKKKLREGLAIALGKVPKAESLKTPVPYKKVTINYQLTVTDEVMENAILFNADEDAGLARLADAFASIDAPKEKEKPPHDMAYFVKRLENLKRQAEKHGFVIEASLKEAE